MSSVCCPPDLVDECGRFMKDDFFRAFIDESRLKVFLTLMEHGEITVNDVAAQMEISQSNVSRHLAFLKNAGVAVSRKEGRETYYRIDYEHVAHKLQSILSIVRVCCPPDESIHQHDGGIAT